MMRAAILAVLLAAGASVRAGEIVVVLPDAPIAPYAEAFKGVCDALGACPDSLAPENADALPPEARVVIALGGRAARLRYPPRVALVTALTPGYEARSRPSEGAVTRVRLTFAPDEFVRRVLSLKPGARRVVLLWSEPASGRFADAVRLAAGPLGLEAAPVRVESPEELPALLRSLVPADALWLSPDPTLVTPMTFEATSEYARSRRIAFFASAPGLTSRGAAPGLAPDFRDAGLRAASAARDALAGRPSAPEAFPFPPAPAPSPEPLVSSKTLGPQ
jgi:hypothetical protein